jgi:uncharacterized membrane protein YheB (UPF0754 family)
MTTEVTFNKSFQEKMFEKVRDQMGDLLTNEELKKIVDAAMDKAFFEKRYDTSGYNKREIDSQFVELIRKEMTPLVQRQVAQWLKDNEAQVLKAIDETIAKGFHALVQQHMENQIRFPLNEFANRLREKGVFL